MASNPYMPLFSAQRPSLSSSLPPPTVGSFPIRARVSVDNDADDDSSGSESHVHESDDGFETDEFASGEELASGEEFDTASDRPFPGDPDEENQVENGFVDKNPIFGPSVKCPEENISENEVTGEEESDDTDENNSAMELDSQKVRPFAQLSMDDDEFDELVGDESMESDSEDGNLSGLVKLPSFGVLERVHSAPRIKLSDIDEDALFDVNTVGVKDSLKDSISINLVNDEGHLVIPESYAESLKESTESVLVQNEEEFKDDMSLVNDSVSVEKDEVDDNAVIPGALDKTLGQCKEDTIEEKQPSEKLEQENVTERIYGSDHAYETVVSPSYETAEVVAEELEEKDNGVDLDVPSTGDEIDCGSVCESVAPKEVENDKKVEVVAGQDVFRGLESPVSEVETVDTAVLTKEIHSNTTLLEALEANELEYAWQSNANSLVTNDEVNLDSEEIGVKKCFLSKDDIEDLIFGASVMKDETLSVAENHWHQLQEVEEHSISNLDEELEIEKELEQKSLLNPCELETFLKAVTGSESNYGSKVFSVEHPASVGSSFRQPIPASVSDVVGNRMHTTGKEEKKMTQKIEHIILKFLRLVHRLGSSPKDSIVAQVLNRLVALGEGHLNEEFSLESAWRMAMQLEMEVKDSLHFSLNILVLGKTGVGKSATINSLLGKKKVTISAFEPATTKVNEIVDTIDGVELRIFDTPGLRSCMKEDAMNRKILASIKKLKKRCPPDVVLYVDRLDAHSKDLNDLPLLRSLTKSLTESIWQNAIVMLTHASSSSLPDGPDESSLNFELFVAQRSHVIQQAISQAVGDPRLMHPNMKHPVSLVENNQACLMSKGGESVLPNGQSWRTELLILCYSLKILSEASSLFKSGDPFDYRKLFGVRPRTLPLPHLISSLLLSRPHPKLAADQSVDNVDSDTELLDISDSDDEHEYDRLPPFKPLRKSQVDKLSKEQRQAYFDEYDYRVKLLQKKQWKGEVKKLEEVKKMKSNVGEDYANHEEHGDQEDEGPSTVSVPMPDFVLPPSFDSENPSYRYRMLEPTSQLLVRPVLDSHGWDHDCGYDGLSLEGNLTLASRYPGAFSIQITEDKKNLNVHLVSSISAKHEDNRSTMMGLDIQSVGRELAYVLRGETKFKNFKINKTSAGISVTILGKSVATGLKMEDQILVGKHLALVGNAGAVRSGGDMGYGANFEVQLKGKDFMLDQNQSILGLSLMNWRGDLSIMANVQSQFFISRNSKVAIQVGLNNKQNGQITVKTSSSELQFTFVMIVPMLLSIFKRVFSSTS